MRSEEPTMRLRWRRRKPATYASRAPKTMTLTVEEVMDLVALVGVLYVDSHRPQPEDPELAALVHRCVQARQLVHNGHKVTVQVTLSQLD